MDERKVNYPDLNLEPLLGNGRYAVHCSTKEEAKHFVGQIKKQYPSVARHWDYGETHWDARENVCYAPYLNEGKSMLWCDREYYERRRYIILEFSDLMPSGDIEESEQPLEFLLQQGGFRYVPND